MLCFSLSLSLCEYLLNIYFTGIYFTLLLLKYTLLLENKLFIKKVSRIIINTCVYKQNFKQNFPARFLLFPYMLK